MQKRERPDIVPEEDSPEPREAGVAEREDGSGSGKADERISELEREVLDIRERYLRALADLDNYRKRAEKERVDLYRNAGERLITGILDVLDGFDQALAVTPDSGEAESILQGIGLLRRQLFEVLEQEGLSEIEATNQPFDPNVHEAVLQVESGDFPSGAVVEEFRRGYLLNGRLLRPAQVSVAK